ncbi:efflux transporter periplasmic adaptor subunit [Pseudoruegeria sp. SK021]|nr:efflux transporter periplasmic adaptor subunit [Pseudoruegeria sp. SK021]
MAILAGVLALLTAIPQPGVAQTPIVKIEEAAANGSGLTRVFFGHVVARETVDLAFQVAGQIVEFPLEEGALVPAGALVAKLDQEPFELSVEEARARSQQEVRTLDRYRQLAGSAVSATTIQDTETEVALVQVALRNAERALGQATLNAPFDALVASRLVPNYSSIDAGTPVVRLHDMSDLRVEIDVPETLFQQAGRNPNVEIYADFPGNPNRYRLEMREFNAETAAVGQTYSITLGMAPPDDLTVLPGSSAKVTATLQTGTPRIEVPASAIVTGNDGTTYVMVFSPAGADQGQVTQTQVTIAATDRGTIEVVSGLEMGQEYVAVGAAALTDGADVRRFTGFGN